MTTADPARAERFLRACRGQSVDTTPIWIMRQAGRYLPQYRKTREKAGDFLTLCKTPELACEVTLQPLDLLGVDAAIIFSDILIPIEAMGVSLRFSEGEGPRLGVVRDEAAARALRVPDPDEATGFVMEAIRLVVRELDGKIPLIGFAGAPWTLFAYAVEGQGTKAFAVAKRMLFENPALAHMILDKIAAATATYLIAQVRAGAAALQIFDSWVGALGPDEYRAFALPYVRRIIDQVRAAAPGTPIIYFCNEATALLPHALEAGADVMGVDFRLPLDEVRARFGERGATLPLQGNLDNCALFAAPSVIALRAGEVIRRGGGLEGRPHIFNLGHGILPETPVEHAVALVEAVHRLGRRPALASAKDRA